jgi:D-aminoacyl-tRNA deacylase
VLAIVVSRADSASAHIGDHLRDLAEWTEHADASRATAEGGGTVLRTEGAELRTFEELHLHLDGVAEAFGMVDDGPDREPTLLVFASRHAGDTGALLTAHHTGNFGPAEFGGSDGDLAAAAPNAAGRVLTALTDHAPEGYETGLECTHHGPTEVGCPSLFVEVGSDEPQWQDPDAARAVARAILDLQGADPVGERTVVGFGGGHYVPRFERVVRETDWTVGHVGADWALDAMADLDRDARHAVLRAAFEESGATRALIDGSHPVAETVAELGYRVVSETYLRETTGVPLGVVERAEDALGTVDDGLRFGEAAGEVADDATLRRISLPAELVAECEGIDRERTRAAVDEHAVALTTTENGTRVGDRALLGPAVERDALIEPLVALLREQYESVEWAEGVVRATRTEFDPTAAREAGVPEGPAFGKLSNGQAVEVGGRTVEPSTVQVEREREFPL